MSHYHLESDRSPPIADLPDQPQMSLPSLLPDTMGDFENSPQHFVTKNTLNREEKLQGTECNTSAVATQINFHDHPVEEDNELEIYSKYQSHPLY